jgi:hypothetical protein
MFPCKNGGTENSKKSTNIDYPLNFMMYNVIIGVPV